jgi:indole-3-glycerol phosphate synthase
MSSGVLDAVVGAARRAAAERARRVPQSAVESAAADRSPRAHAMARALSRPGVRVIAECKRRSPSRGILRRYYRPAHIAAGYARAGAAAISVLTEPTFFDGSLDHLREVRAAVDLPILRKDFIVNEYQIVEARAAGADAVLLIVAALDDRDLRVLMTAAAAYGLAALVEAHDADEARRAVDAGATLVGVNSRNLRTLEVSPAVFDAVAPLLPETVVAVAESGITSAGDLTRLSRLRYDAFLIGERFMTAASPGEALAVLLDQAEEAES